MKLFVIGGTGYIGSVVCERLRADGHELRGLARSDDSAAQLSETGSSRPTEHSAMLMSCVPKVLRPTGWCR